MHNIVESDRCKVKNAYMALQGSFMASVMLLVITLFIGILIFVNQKLSTDGLSNIKQSAYLPNFFIDKQVKYYKEADSNASCPIDYSLSSDFIYDFMGTKATFIVKKYTYQYTCQVLATEENLVQYGYTASNCRIIKGKSICDWTINTENSSKCVNINSQCFCPGFLSFQPKDQDIKIREVEKVDPILPQRVFFKSINNLPICEKVQIIQEMTFFDNQCLGGRYCFGYACLKGVVECPDYSLFAVQRTNNRFISSGQITPVSTPCGNLAKYDSINEQSLIDNESNFLLSLLEKEKYTGCDRINSESNDNIIEFSQPNKLEFYRMFNQELINNITALDSKIQDNVESYQTFQSYLTSKITISANSHIPLILSEQCVNKRFTIQGLEGEYNIISNLNEAFLAANMVFSNANNSFWFIFQILFIIGKLVFIILLLIRSTKITDFRKSLSIVRYGLLLLFGKAVFKVIMFFLVSNIHYYHSIADNLRVTSSIPSNCFGHPKYNTYLNELASSLDQFQDLYVNSSNKELLIDLASLALYALLYIPVFGFKSLFLFKKLKDS